MIFGLAFRAWDNSRMVAYTVHEQPNPPMDRIDRAEGLVFVKDGFVWSAAVLAPIWMVSNALWLPFLGYVASVVILSSVLSLLGLGEPIVVLAFLALHVLIGFEADTLKRWTLEQSGWDNVGMVSGSNLQECERHFFDSWLKSQPVLRTGAAAPLPGDAPSVGEPSSASVFDTAMTTKASSKSLKPTSKRSWSWMFGGQKA